MSTEDYLIFTLSKTAVLNLWVGTPTGHAYHYDS